MDPGVSHLANGGEAAPDQLIAAWAVCDSGAPTGEPPDLGLVWEDAVRDPAPVAAPTDVLEVLERTLAQRRQAVFVFVAGLGDVSVQPYIESLGELCCPAHQSRCHRERRAWCEGDADHGAVRGIVVTEHEPFGVGENFVVVLHHRVRWQPTVLLREAHRTACRMESHSQLRRCGDLSGDQVTATPWMHI